MTEPVAALPGIDGVNWPQLGHAYGKADDLPGLLRAVAGHDEGSAEKALDDLWSRVCHQGTVYSASAAVVPFLTELATRVAVDVGGRGCSGWSPRSATARPTWTSMAS
ncbi:MAG: hypothetical protein ACRDT6_02375 [Micromonosporaceae bacterium]